MESPQGPLRGERLGGFKAPDVEIPAPAISCAETNTKRIKMKPRHFGAIRRKRGDFMLLLKLKAAHLAVTSTGEVCR